MKRSLFNLTALLSLMLCAVTTGVFFLGGFLPSPPPPDWVINLPNSERLSFNRDEVMLERYDGHGGFPNVAEVFYMWIATPAAILPICWLMRWLKHRDQTRDPSGFPVVHRNGRGH